MKIEKNEHINKNYNIKKISDIFNISRGKVLSNKYINENKGVYPVYSSATNNKGEIGKISSYNLSGEKLTWTTDGYYAGTVFYRKGKYNCTNVCGIMDLKNKEECVRYYSYLLKNKLYKYVVKTDNRKLMSNVVEKIEINYNSDIKQQEKIASALSLQERQIEIIEELIEKLETRNQYYAEKLLSGEKRIRRNEQGKIEFYDNTEWQEVSLNGKVVSIPVGWEVKNMNEIIHLKKGTSIKSDLLNYNGDGVPYLRTNEVWEKSSVNKDKVYYDGELNNIELKTKDDYVLCLDGFNTEPSLGTVGLVTNNGEGICCGELHKITDIENISKKYVNVMLLKGKLFQNLICRYAEGSTVKHAGKHFKKIENILISFEEQLILNEMFKKQLSEIDLLKKIKEKEKLRFQWMLNNLLSGEYQIID